MDLEQLAADVVRFQVELISWGTFLGYLAAQCVMGLARVLWQGWKNRRD